MNAPDPVPFTVGAAPWYTSQVMIGAVITLVSTLAGIAPKAATALGLTSPSAISTDVGALFQVIAVLAGLFTAVQRARAGLQPLTLTRGAAASHPATVAAAPKAQQGHARVGILVLLGLCALVACKSLPSFTQLALTAGTVNDTTLNALDAAVKAKAITGTEATAALKITDAVQAAIVTANNAYQAGNQTGAVNDLAAVTSALTALQGCIGSPATFTQCLQGVPAP